ncbi:MAG: hypothetical protein ACTSU3_00750 [Candidatus Thorarchaeota archaeon]
MRVLVIGSCGKKKKFSIPNAPRCSDLITKSDLQKWRNIHSDFVCPTREMYTGNQHRELVHGADLLRQIKGIEVHLFVISAGFGLLEEYEPIPPYECSFSKMKTQELLERAAQLSLKDDIKRIFQVRYDLAYIALGKKYLKAIDADLLSGLNCTVVKFGSTHPTEQIIHVPTDTTTIKAISRKGYKIHGIAGFKGDLLRILAKYALAQSNPYNEVASWIDSYTLLQLVYDLGALGIPPQYVQTSITTDSS